MRRATGASSLGEKRKLSPVYMVSSIWNKRGLIRSLAAREIRGKYKGSVFGMAWSAITPLLMLGTYTFVFSVVFQSRWVEGGSRIDFALILFLSILAYSIFGEVAVRAPTLVTSNANFVKKVVFPLEVLPCVAICTSLFHAAIAGTIWLFATFFVGRDLPWTAVIAPFYLISLILGTLGIAWFLAALGVFLRDIGQIIAVLVTALLFLSPIFYSPKAVPPEFRLMVDLNPMAYIIEGLRSVVVFGEVPDFMTIVFLMLGGALLAWLGFVFFQLTRRGFADVL
jgi:lipopolysaccharide transport system permease protein